MIPADLGAPSAALWNSIIVTASPCSGAALAWRNGTLARIDSLGPTSPVVPAALPRFPLARRPRTRGSHDDLRRFMGAIAHDLPA